MLNRKQSVVAHSRHSRRRTE